MELYRLFLGLVALIGSAQLYGVTAGVKNNLTNESIAVCFDLVGYNQYPPSPTCKEYVVAPQGTQRYTHPSLLKIHVIDQKGKKYQVGKLQDGSVYNFNPDDASPEFLPES